MVKIDLSQLKGLDKKEIISFLLQGNDMEIALDISKKKVAGIDSNIAVCSEYLLASFIGQNLSYISENLSYFVPNPESLLSFSFRFYIKDLEKFADEILETIVAVTAFEADPLYFQQQESLYLKNAKKAGFNCRTWGLLKIADEFKNKIRKE